MPTTPKLQIAVLSEGFVYIGLCQRTDDELIITKAQCIRHWGTTAGLGQLAASGPTTATKLDSAGTITVPDRALNHRIDCIQSAWAEHFQVT